MEFDAQMVQMFETMVLPTMKQMPTPALREIQTYLNDQIDAELAQRERTAVETELQRRQTTE